MPILPLHEFDWHISSTRRILKTLAEVLDEVDRELDNAVEQYQIDDAIDKAENVLGLAFIVAQVYVTSTIGRLNRMARLPIPITKQESLKAFGETLGGLGITDIQLTDAVANYYKHHDEWHDFAKPGPRARILKILEQAGIDIAGPYPCVQAGEILFSHERPEYLSRLPTMLTRWRERQIEAIRKAPPPPNSPLSA